ncbi:MAG: T9SS type A sorting domain-containing protein [Melioribacteraceae bacterium]|nr:T9SS type A sorting domain-containing protein [Melioribacteraceae bacterium]MCF8354551.1 T9SS type A sorting domain-containing protein [Melioribacteraceae bacterium]MCF8394483.1 T9SS type A sorting domain-containing protein [Melioribacteraceae bacterium]MCF8420107.1 T9SS type A sorting domain-containing protein [Melioribacteraceae bacterium]
MKSLTKYFYILLALVFLSSVNAQSFSPVDGLTGVTIRPTFTWSGTGATTDFYVRVYSSDPTGALTTATPLENSGAAVSSGYSLLDTLDNNTQYWWTLDADDVYTGETADYGPFTFYTIPEVSISLSNPGDGETVYTDDIMFTWYAGQPTNNLQFNLQVTSTFSGVDPNWTVLDVDETTTDLYYDSPAGILLGEDYAWRVVVEKVTPNEVVNYSGYNEFSTSGGAVAVNLSWPVDDAVVYTNTPTVYWYLDLFGSGLTYEVIYSTNSSSVDGVTGELNDGAVTLSSTTNLYFEFPSALDAGSDVWWQVKTTYNGSEYAWSSVEHFTVEGDGTLRKPTISYPSDVSTIYTTSPYIYWYVEDGSTAGLQFLVEIDDGGGWVTATGAALTSDLYDQIIVDAGATYDLRVKVTNDGGLTYDPAYYSDVITFTVAGGIGDGYPIASWPTGGATVYTTTPTLSWYVEGSTLGIDHFEVEVDYGSGFTNVYTSSDANDRSYTLTSGQVLSFGGSYLWRVASFDAATNSAWSTETFSVVGSASSIVPEVSYPVGGVTVNSTTVSLYWFVNGSTTGIDHYEVEWTAVASGWNTTSPYGGSQNNITDQYYEVSGLTAGATYRWHVRAYNGSGVASSYSSEGSFVVDPGSAPVMVMPGSPANGINILSNSAELSWILPTQSESALTYELEFADNAELTDAQSYSDISSPVQMIDGLEDGKTYYWRVRSKNSDGDYSLYSDVTSFGVGEVTSVKREDAVAEKYVLSQNFPNPFNPTTNIKFSIPEAGLVSLKIFNILGQEIRTLVSDVKESGSYQVTWNGKDDHGNSVSTGIYLYKIQANDYSATKKMLLIK